MGINENTLRGWLKQIWGPGLQWVEAGRGGSVGLPDVNLPLGDGTYMPAELKAWWFTSKGLLCNVRPAQVRYHTMLAREGGRSIFLIAVMNDYEFDVFAFPGSMCPVTRYAPRLSIWRIGGEDRMARQQILDLMKSYSFWEK